MKKFTFNLLIFSIASFADSLNLKCQFPEYKEEGRVKVYTMDYKTYFKYSGPKVSCELDNVFMTNGFVYISDESIDLDGNKCNVRIDRESGKITVREWGGFNKISYEGTCVRLQNAI